MGIVEATDVRYAYTGENSINLALDGVTMMVAKGAFVAIIGHNGSGKSTFAKHINALFSARIGQGRRRRHGHGG